MLAILECGHAWCGQRHAHEFPYEASRRASRGASRGRHSGVAAGPNTPLVSNAPSDQLHQTQALQTPAMLNTI
jgi:hypothetical protein